MLIHHGSLKTYTGEKIMNEKQTRVFKETRLRNFQRHYTKLTQHPELTNTALTVKKEIETLKKELQ